MFDEYDFNMNFHFFGDDDMSPEERAKLERELRARIEMARNHPIALKAREIHTIVDALVESIEPDDDDDPDVQYLAEGEEYDDYSDEEVDDFEPTDDDDADEPSDEEEREMLMATLLHHTKRQMMVNSMTIGAKFAAVAAQDSYILAMENAVLIKIAARDLLAQSAMLQYEGTADPEHIQVLRRAVEEFREIFIEWVATLKPNDDDEPDGWGLFL
jgi:hypothetical protein